MAIEFHPGYGTILFCDFSHQTEPEMVKTRPVVVLSRRNKNAGICTVVPLSGTEPVPMQPWHCLMDRDKLPETIRKMGQWWAKCDCLASVSFARLDRIKNGRCPNTGRRLYLTPQLNGNDLHAIKMGVISHLGMMNLVSQNNP